MKIKNIILLIVAFFCVFKLSYGTSPYQDSTSTEITFIPVIDITSKLTSINAEIYQKKAQLLTEVEKNTIKTETDTLVFRVKLLREDARIQEIDNLSFRSLSEIESEWSVMKSRLQLKESELLDILKSRESVVSELGNLIKEWDMTRVNAIDEEASDQLVSRIEITVDSLERARFLFREDSDFIQNLMIQVSSSLIFCDKVLSEISVANNITGSHIFKLTQPPIWKVLKSSGEETVVIRAERSVIDDIFFEIKEFSSDETFRILLHFILFLVLLFTIRHSFRDIREQMEKGERSELHTISSIVEKPFTATLLITFLSSYLIYVTLPASIGFLNLVLLFLPVMYILYDIMPEKTRNYIILPSIAVMLAYAHSYSFSDNLFSRLFLVSIDLFSIISVVFAIRKRTFRDNAPSARAGMTLYYLALTGITMMFISLIGSIVGAVRLAEFITYATLKSLALVFIIYAINKTLNSVIYTLIHSKASDKFKALSYYRDNIYRKISGFVTIVSWLLWAIIAMKLFAIWDKVSSVIISISNYGIKLGTTSFSLANVLVFILVVTITIWLSRVIKIIIEGEVAPRVKMKRGVPGAVTLLLRISIITAGFLLAIASAGVEMDKLAILLGALGVGIGFGLQNIFNNLVSGIILAFERPIQEGDIIEVGELWGTVKEIGIRSSVIFTFDGAEVIVPNGNLISNELINWTLTNQHRRIEVLVGVAYGTDPEKVLDILREVADKEPLALKEPVPLALFTGFGESSLDFRMLFWIENAENRYIVQSKVNVEINRAINEAGITIPFPQHDLHIKTIDKEIGDQYLK